MTGDGEAINGDRVPAEDSKLLSEVGELPAYQADGLPIVPSVGGNAHEIRGEAFDEPHYLNGAVGFPFQSTAGADTVEVAIEIELEEITGVIRGGSGIRSRLRPSIYILKCLGVDKGEDRVYYRISEDFSHRLSINLTWR
jgi:hypothetical protein